MPHGSNIFYNDIYAHKEHKNNKHPVIISDVLNVQGRQSYTLLLQISQGDVQFV